MNMYVFYNFQPSVLYVHSLQIDHLYPFTDSPKQDCRGNKPRPQQVILSRQGGIILCGNMWSLWPQKNSKVKCSKCIAPTEQTAVISQGPDSIEGQGKDLTPLNRSKLPGWALLDFAFHVQFVGISPK